MDDHIKTVLARIHGRVQGVSFRAWTQQEAAMLGLAGWVRNEPDGSVSALLQGTADTVDAMIGRLHKGPRSARVESVTVGNADQDTRLSGFKILR